MKFKLMSVKKVKDGRTEITYEVLKDFPDEMLHFGHIESEFEKLMISEGRDRGAITSMIWKPNNSILITWTFPFQCTTCQDTGVIECMWIGFPPCPDCRREEHDQWYEEYEQQLKEEELKDGRENT